MTRVPRVTVVIPHWNGVKILRRCLTSLKKTVYPDYAVLLVNNGSTDGSRGMVARDFPDVSIVDSPTNVGFAAGCNLGIRHSASPYVVLLNNDTEVTPEWLGFMVEAADRDVSVAAVQPKMLSFTDRQRFDYCGGAGGEMDLFGYPFAWGRLFDSIESDEGQYDAEKQVFWASGAATLLRRSALDKVGLLNEAFFAHMEEIDLNWRFQWAGYRIQFVPSSVVYHQTGATLGKERLRKMVLNHRNNLLMILRNHTIGTLLWLFPLRLILEGMTFFASFLIGQPKRALAVLGGLFGVLIHWKNGMEGRKMVNTIRSVPEGVLLHRMYRGSVALAYFLFGIRKASDLSHVIFT